MGRQIWASKLAEVDEEVGSGLIFRMPSRTLIVGLEGLTMTSKEEFDRARALRMYLKSMMSSPLLRSTPARTAKGMTPASRPRPAQHTRDLETSRDTDAQMGLSYYTYH